jgi:hypothetical protein
MTQGCVNSFALRHEEDIIQTTSSSQERQRLQVPCPFLERIIHDLNEDVQGCMAELVLNLDQVGISDWEDRKSRKVVVPATMRGQTTHHGISRNVKDISVIACVFAAGESLIPYRVSSQDSVPVQEQLKKHVIGFGTWLILRSNREPYVNTEIFLDSIQTMFLPNLIELRTLDDFAEEFTLLLMDNCSNHITADVIVLLTEALVRFITFAPHTTQRYELPFEDAKAIVKFIMKIYHDFKQTMGESNIWRALQALGFEFDTRTEPCRLLFNQETLRASADFQELWSIYFPWINCRLDDVLPSLDHPDNLSRLQTDNGRVEHLGNFSGTWL